MCDIINNFNNKINDIVNKNVETKINEIKNKVSKKIIELYKNKDVKKIKLNDILKLFDEFNDNNINILYDEELEIYKFKEARTFYVLENTTTNINSTSINDFVIIGKIKNNEIINLSTGDILKCKKNNWKYTIKNDDNESESE
jgi:hypothetical protein